MPKRQQSDPSLFVMDGACKLPSTPDHQLPSLFNQQGVWQRQNHARDRRLINLFNLSAIRIRAEDVAVTISDRMHHLQAGCHTSAHCATSSLARAMSGRGKSR